MPAVRYVTPCTEEQRKDFLAQPGKYMHACMQYMPHIAVQPAQGSPLPRPVPAVMQHKEHACIIHAYPIHDVWGTHTLY